MSNGSLDQQGEEGSPMRYCLEKLPNGEFVLRVFRTLKERKQYMDTAPIGKTAKVSKKNVEAYLIQRAYDQEAARRLTGDQTP